ncbi:MAG: DNA alkylation repair protein [Nocardioides sp.]
MNSDGDLVAAIRGVLADAGDPERAASQQAYMKSEMPYRGISSPELRRLLAPLLGDYRPTSRRQHETTVRTLWDSATHREEWYAAIAVARHRRVRSWLDATSLDLSGHLVVTGAWWDVVDEIASHLVGAALAHDRRAATPTIWAWASDADPWLRRTAVICQLGAKVDTDVDLLRHAVEVNVADSSFWLRKGIGWALREYAKTDPAWVRSEVGRHGDLMSGLTRREATKHLH